VKKKASYYLIGICGGSASGKSLFIEKLKHNFENESLCVISQDDYYKDYADQKKDARGMVNFDLPEAIDDKALYRDLVYLDKGIEVKRREYTFGHKTKIPEIRIYKASKVVILEGLFIFHYAKIFALMDMKVFIYADEKTRYERRRKRDFELRGIPQELIDYQWENHVMPAYRNCILPASLKADIIINNEKSFEKGLILLSDHVEKILKE
jgi:uridine kinase